MTALELIRFILAGLRARRFTAAGFGLLPAGLGFEGLGFAGFGCFGLAAAGFGGLFSFGRAREH